MKHNFRPGSLICCSVQASGCTKKIYKRTGNFNNPSFSQINIVLNAIRHPRLTKTTTSTQNRLVVYGRVEGQPGGILGKPTNF
jgi:hypothetical protein